MFELYDEPARRTLFFARYEASRLGIPCIETEHLLLGLIREPRGHAKKLLMTLPLTDIRRELESSRAAEKIAVSVEIPFSAETKLILQHASEEAERLTDRHVGPEHLLLGLLREPGSRAAVILSRYGMRLEDAREQLRESYTSPAVKRVQRSEVQTQLEQIIESAHQLRISLSGDAEAAIQADMLLLDLEMLKSLLDDDQ